LVILAADRNGELPLVEIFFVNSTREKDEGMWRLLWPVRDGGIRTGVNGNHDVHASRLHEVLPERHVLVIRTAVNELQPPGVQILEIGFP
jgi:hypothetical protein